MMNLSDTPLQPGDTAPRFQLPAVNREGTVSLEDYRDKRAVMVCLYRGLHCPFCRRHIARLATVRDKLAEQGVATVAIVNTELERARQYFQYRPVRVELGTDPEALTHRAFGVAKLVLMPDTTDPRELQWPRTGTMAQLMNNPVNPHGDLPEKMNLMAATQYLNQKDGFEMTDVDTRIFQANGTQFTSQFLVDAGGVVRWSFVEARDGPEGMGGSAGEEEMVAAAKAVGR